jgi:ABC-2 type transport system ATP-binding protein
VPEAISVQDLTKVYGPGSGGVAAVDHVSFQVQKGEIFGFIGPNGAGKTTTIKTLLGLIFPTSGAVTVLGQPAGDIEVKRRIAYLPESPYFYEHMTGYEVLDFYARLFGMDKETRKSKIAALMEQVGLARDGKRVLRQYSKGMLQRIGIAQALINDPDIMFLDEPTSGLDPIAHKDIQDLIRSLKKQGKTVLLSSHQLIDVENVCDRVAIINRGKLVKIGSMDELLHAGTTVITLAHAADDIQDKVKPLADKTAVEGEYLRVTVRGQENIQSVLDTARGKADLVSVVPQRQSLEDLFVEIVREAGR